MAASLPFLALNGSIIKQSGDTQYLDHKLEALNNMLYCYVVRFNKTDDARLGDCPLKQFSAFEECLLFILL